MGPGLVKILNLIKAKPSETMLIDRFLVLASDLGEYERVDATLKLATSLILAQPRRAIEVAWMTYKSGNKTRECLEIIVGALEKLERFEKVAAIKNELLKTDSLLVTEEVKDLAKITIEEHIANVVSGAADPEISRQNHIDSFKSSSEETSSFKLQSSPVVDLGHIDIAPVMQFKIPDVASDPLLPTSEARNRVTEIDSRNQRKMFSLTQESPLVDGGERVEAGIQEPQKIDSIVRISFNEPNEGIPEAIPPKESSQLSSKFMEDAARLNHKKPKSDPLKSDDREGYSDSNQARAKKKRKDYLSVDSDESKDESVISEKSLFDSFVVAISREDWERVLEDVERYIKLYGGEKLLAYFENRKLYQIDLRFSSAWVDLLLRTQQERRALRFLIQKLSEEPQLAWAKMVWSKIPSITDALDLTPIHWREAEGVAVLRNKLATQTTRLGCYFIHADQIK